MMDYLLIYEINDYPDCGGGYYYKEYEDYDALEEGINELSKGYGETFKVCKAVRIEEDFDVKSVETVTRWKLS